MKILKSIVALAAATAGLSAYAQEATNATATKTAQPYVYRLVEGIYGRVEARHYTNVKVIDEKTDTVPYLQFRPVLGLKLSDKLFTELALRINKNAETSKIEQAAPYSYTELEIYNNDYVDVRPYAELLLPANGAGTTGNADMVVAGTLPIDTAIGKLTPFVDFDGRVAVNSRSEPTTRVTNRTGKDTLSLTGVEQDGKTITTAQREPTTSTMYGGGLRYVPDALPALFAELHTGFTRQFSPRYEIREAGEDDQRLEKAGYEPIDSTESYLLLKYGITPDLAIRNDFFVRHGGFFASNKRVNEADADPRVQNVLRLAYTIK